MSCAGGRLLRRRRRRRRRGHLARRRRRSKEGRAEKSQCTHTGTSVSTGHQYSQKDRAKKLPSLQRCLQHIVSVEAKASEENLKKSEKPNKIVGKDLEVVEGEEVLAIANKQFQSNSNSGLNKILFNHDIGCLAVLVHFSKLR